MLVSWNKYNPSVYKKPRKKTRLLISKAPKGKKDAFKKSWKHSNKTKKTKKCSCLYLSIKGRLLKSKSYNMQGCG